MSSKWDRCRHWHDVAAFDCNRPRCIRRRVSEDVALAFNPCDARRRRSSRDGNGSGRTSSRCCVSDCALTATNGLRRDRTASRSHRNHGHAAFSFRFTSVDSCGSTSTATSRNRCKATSKASEYPVPESTLKGLADLGSCPTIPRTLRTPREGSLPHQRRVIARGRIQGPRRRPLPPRWNSARRSNPLRPRCFQVFAADT